MPSKWGNRLFCPVSSPQAISLTSTGYLTSYKRDKEKKFAWVSENPTPQLKKNNMLNWSGWAAWPGPKSKTAFPFNSLEGTVWFSLMSTNSAKSAFLCYFQMMSMYHKEFSLSSHFHKKNLAKAERKIIDAIFSVP